MSSYKVFTLKNRNVELAYVPEYGCYWQSLRVFFCGEWRDLLEPLVGDAPPFHFGSYVMAPWSNRIVDAAFEFQGKRYQLKKNFPDDTAIHGDSRTRPWKIERASKESVTATLDSRDFQDYNYPFAIKFTHRLILSDNQITMSLAIQNLDSRECPVGFGFHPFFRRRLTSLDKDIVVMLPAEKVYPDIKCIPTGPAVAVSEHTDLRNDQYLGNPNLDHCYTALTDHVVRMRYRESKVEVNYKMDSVFSHCVVYAPQDPEGNPKSFVAVEPVTHVNNGFNFLAQGWQGTGVKILKPGEIWGGGADLTIRGL